MRFWGRYEESTVDLAVLSLLLTGIVVLVDITSSEKDVELLLLLLSPVGRILAESFVRILLQGAPDKVAVDATVKEDDCFIREEALLQEGGVAPVAGNNVDAGSSNQHKQQARGAIQGGWCC